VPWPLIKQIHIGFAVLVVCSFCLRAYWIITGSPHLRPRWARWTLHVLDTLLFAAGLTMAIGLSISPLTHSWFAAKLIAIVAYILIVGIALKGERTRGARVMAVLSSLLVLGYIFAVALHHDPWAGFG
jgi:uncharacterized membrane protein SirB2